MPRPIRVEYPGAWYVVSNVAIPSQKLFRHDADYQQFLTVLSDACRLYGVECHAYGLVKTSFYILLRTPLANLNRMMRHLSSVYTQYRVGKKGDKVFKGRYKSVLLGEPDTIVAVSQWIHLLPFKHKPTPTAASYAYSSLKYYASEVERSFVDTRWILGTFKDGVPRQAYMAFMDQPISEDLLRFFKKKKRSPFLGSEQFIQVAKASFSHQPTALQDRRSKSPLPTMDTLIQSTAAVFKESIEHIVTSKRGRHNQQLGRSVAMYLCRYVGQYTIKQIATAFCVTHESTVSVRIRRFKSLLEKTPQLQQKMKLLTLTAGKYKVS